MSESDAQAKSDAESGVVVAKTQSGVWAQLKRSADYVWLNTLVLGTSTKETALIKKVEYDLEARKKKFGVEYSNLLLAGKESSDEDVVALVVELEKDLEKFQEQIKSHEMVIAQQKEELNQKFRLAQKDSSSATSADGGDPDFSVVSVNLKE